MQDAQDSDNGFAFAIDDNVIWVGDHFASVGCPAFSIGLWVMGQELHFGFNGRLQVLGCRAVVLRNVTGNLIQIYQG